MPGRLLQRLTTPPSPPTAPLAQTKSRPTSRPTLSASPMEQIKRHSLAALGKSKDKPSRKGSPSPAASRPQKNQTSLDIIPESPPAVFYGNANQSTGALYAGQLRLNVVEPEIMLSTLTLKLLAVTTARKPVAKDCLDCSSQTTELKEWTFLTHPKTFEAGSHSLPFSYLIPGHLPITTHGDLGMIQYFLSAKATKVSNSQSPQSATATDSTIVLRKELHVSRAVRPLDEKTSLRIFPPTNLTARVSHEPIIHPIGEFNVQMLVTGITEKHKDTQARWRLRRMNWRLEETEKMISPACTKHAQKVGGQGRGIAHEDTKTVGRDELKSGWKTDLSEGQIEMEFVVRPSRPRTDVESPNGLVISHALVIELVIAEEWAPNKNPEKATPTGAARILRMQFAIMVTERSGMGISWDEEQPPMYEDVPASPPLYPQDAQDLRNPFAGGSAPPGYAEGIEEEETPDIQRTRSELLNYTGTPLSPTYEVDEDDFEGLSLGPSRLQYRNASNPRGAGSSNSRIVASSSTSTSTSGSGSATPVAAQSQSASVARTGSNRGRSRLGLEDFEIDGPYVPSPREDNDTPRPPSPQEGKVA